MNLNTVNKNRIVTAIWPLFAVALFCLGIWLTIPKLFEFHGREVVRQRATRLMAEEQKCLADIKKLNNQPADNKELLAAREALAEVYNEGHQFNKAQEIYLDVFKTRLAHTKPYDEQLVATALSVAQHLCDMGGFAKAEAYYKLVWNYDKENLEKTDPRLIRDLNNLGVATFLKAMSIEDGLERELEFNRANFYLIQAQLANRVQAKVDRQDEANSWENRANVLQELGGREEAKALRRKARAVHLKIPFRIPQP